VAAWNHRRGARVIRIVNEVRAFPDAAICRWPRRFRVKGRPPANAAGSPEALPEKLTWIVRHARPPTAAPLFDLFSQDGASRRIHEMDLAAYRTGHRLIDMLILRNIFGGKALNAVSGFGAAVHEERHSENIPLRVTEWIDLDQSLRRTTAKFKRGQWDGKGLAAACGGLLALYFRRAWRIPKATIANATGIQFWKWTPKSLTQNDCL
jgi:hypothetical protein